MNIVEVSTPGKLMLFGEHAVVYGKPCLVTAVDQRMRVTIERVRGAGIILEAPEVGVSGQALKLGGNDLEKVPRGAKFVAAAINNWAAKYPLATGLLITTKSEFLSEFGFGSSSAVTVGLIKGLSELWGKDMGKKELFDLAYQSVLDVQGVGSGFDLAAAIWGGTVYFKTGGTIIEPVAIKGLPLVVGYTGVKADTATLVQAVADQKAQFPDLVENIFEGIEQVVLKAKICLENGDLETTGKLMNINQGYLESLGVGTVVLAKLIYAAREAHTWGAKLSGAGGGDCMIALGADSEKIEEALDAVGGRIIKVKTGAEGVRVENKEL